MTGGKVGVTEPYVCLAPSNLKELNSMTDVAYVRTQVGNKLFTISWTLVASGEGAVGVPFEARDCKLVSIYASALEAIDLKLHQTNFNVDPPTPANLGTGVTIELVGGILLNKTTPNADSRWYYPSCDAGEGTGQVHILFQPI